MDVTIIVALIVLIGTLCGQRLNESHELKKMCNSKRDRLFENTFISFQKLMNLEEDSFFEFQKATLRVSIFCEKHVSECMGDYYYTFVDSGSEMKAEEHEGFQKKILNAMRQDIGLEPLDRFKVIRYTPQTK